MSRDLLVLAADKDAQFAIRCLLSRYTEIGISIDIADEDVIVHPKHDSGVLSDAANYARSYISSHKHILVIFDYEGSGSSLPPETTESNLEKILSINGWDGRVSVIAITPELEQWLWNGSNRLALALSHTNHCQLKSSVESLGFTFNAADKPNRPKEAFDEIRRFSRIPRSSSLFAKLARELPFSKCRDRAFLKLLESLRNWFPAN